MSGEPERKAKSPALAAFLILIGTGVVFYFLPRVMIALGDVSPWLSGALGTLLVLGFFLLFWLRARYQRRREN
jgi:protein-S-isoprenylcysteine O-methyltransferase Ste14